MGNGRCGNETVGRIAVERPEFGRKDCDFAAQWQLSNSRSDHQMTLFARIIKRTQAPL